MDELQGQRVSDGIAIGKAMILTSQQVKVRRHLVDPSRTQTELRKFRRALHRTIQEMTAIRNDQKGGQADVLRIISTSLEFLSDDFLAKEIERRIEEECYSASYAVSDAVAVLTEQLESINDPTFSSKVSDMIDIEHRLLNNLLGGRLERFQELPGPRIVIADDLTPTQAVTLDRDKVLGFATERGSWASHTGILARALGIPAVVGLKGLTALARLDDTVIIDGYKGSVFLDPESEQVSVYRQKRRQTRRRIQKDIQTRELPAQTRDGEDCRIYCNIETKQDIPRVKEYGGAGVGLFRTEFLFLGQTAALSEDEQYEVYREAIDGMEGRMVTIRSMDFGADKFDRVYGNQGEPNPFLGERAIRISFREEDFFRVQLRAILRAAAHGKIRLMFPLVSDLEEFRRAKQIVEKAKQELRDRGVPFEESMPVGTMIELPSAVYCMRRLAEEADFFSIGTNDLTQYTLGVDRTNQAVASYYACHHPAVVSAIDRVVREASRRQRYLSICGEMAGNPLYVPLLLGLGVRNFSVAVPQVPVVKRRIREVYLSHCIKLARQAREAAGPEEVMEFLQSIPGA